MELTCAFLIMLADWIVILQTKLQVEDDLVIGWCEKTPPICQPTYNDKEKTTIEIQQDTVTQSKGL